MDVMGRRGVGWGGELALVVREKIGEGRCIVSSLDVCLLPYSWALLVRPLVNGSLRVHI